MKLAKSFVIMGGAFNVGFDSDAASIVSQFPVPKTYIPFDLCDAIQVSLREFDGVEDERVHADY